MTLVIPAGSVNASMIFSFEGSAVRASCSIAIHPTGDVNLPAICGAVGDAWISNYQPVTASSVTLAAVAAETAENSIEIPVGESGDSTSFDNDTYEALVVKKITALKGRKHRGRMYLPGLLSAGSVLIDGTLGPSTVAALQTPTSAFFADLGAAGVPELLHSDATDPDAILGLVVSPRVGIQRRRRAKLT